MYIGDEVTESGGSDPKGPDAVGALAEHTHVEILPELCQEALSQGVGTSLAWGVLGAGQEGPVGEGEQRQNKHEGTQHLEGLGQFDFIPQHFDEEGERHGEDATSCRYHTIG